MKVDQFQIRVSLILFGTTDHLHYLYKTQVALKTTNEIATGENKKQTNALKQVAIKILTSKTYCLLHKQILTTSL
jgi:hypothetical protein